MLLENCSCANSAERAPHSQLQKFVARCGMFQEACAILYPSRQSQNRPFSWRRRGMSRLTPCWPPWRGRDRSRAPGSSWEAEAGSGFGSCFRICAWLLCLAPGRTSCRTPCSCTKSSVEWEKCDPTKRRNCTGLHLLDAIPQCPRTCREVPRSATDSQYH